MDIQMVDISNTISFSHDSGIKASPNTLTLLEARAKWHGLLVLSKVQDQGQKTCDGTNVHALTQSSSSLGSKIAPITLIPAPFPRDTFLEAIALQPLFNSLLHSVSRDYEFLRNCLDSAAKNDEFTRNLVNIFEKSVKLGKKQYATLGIHRCDYFLQSVKKEDKLSYELRQIELNTISASFAHLSLCVQKLHQEMLEYFHSDHKNTHIVDDRMSIIIEGIARAHTIFLERAQLADAHVLMVVLPHERNIFDQKGLEDMLFKSYQIRMTRKTLFEISEQGHVNEAGIFTVNEVVMSVVYFRAGYSPDDYPSDKEWKAREMMELSVAIKCPSIAYHLAGEKKVQHMLSEPAVMERFVSDPRQCQRMRKCFANFYRLEGDKNESSNDIIKEAIAHPEKFVMKPQREGGGNNFFDKALSELLSSLRSDDERSRFILMERLYPPTFSTIFIRDNDGITSEDVDKAVSELGIYGVYLHDGTNERINEPAGYLLRTKHVTTNEGGVASGYAVLDSVCLVD